MMQSGNRCKALQTEGDGSHIPSASEKPKVIFTSKVADDARKKLLKKQDRKPHILQKETKNLHVAPSDSSLFGDCAHLRNRYTPTL